MHPVPVVLEGNAVRLEPLAMTHCEALYKAGQDERLWEFTTSIIRTPEEMRVYIETALQWQREGTALPFATIERSSGIAVGSTRFANIDTTNRRVEIGWTWIAPPWQRTAVNTEAKYLMLCHAFEVLGCLRVEFKTDALNRRSRTALSRIGAREEGTLRRHMRVHTGRMRDTVYYSILDTEWPSVKHLLEKKMCAHRNSPVRTESA